MKSEKWSRTHNCGQLRGSDEGKSVTLMGWVASHRDHGGLIFVDLRDRWGVTQLVFNPSENSEIVESAKSLRMETVIGIRGVVHRRPDEMINASMPTGEIEVNVEEMTIFNHSKPLPFMIKDDCDAMDELRLKYRYLDLRRPVMKRNIFLRHRAAQSVRKYFDEKGFIEIETPFLMKSTPEGARDFLVPSRIHKGKFYALPQSPQTYKQLLMVSGFDRYFQIVKCFRDEDLRADRQPEFTQIDVEMSFITEEDIYNIIEGLIVRLFRDVLEREIKRPFQRLKFEESMARYGTDSPDLRFGMEIVDISDIVKDSGFRVFSEAVKSGGCVRGLCLKNGVPISRKRSDELNEFVRSHGAKGVVILQKKGDETGSGVAKFLTQKTIDQIEKRFDMQTGDVLFLVADDEDVCSRVLGTLRVKLAEEYDLIKGNQFAIAWIVDFPLLEWSDAEDRYVPRHHPFTAAVEEDVHYLDESPQMVRARAYDLVLNGYEIGGGSIRNHTRSMQERMFKILGIDEKTAQRKFGFLMEALELGAPPHGGIALGFDRLVMILAGERSIREVIPFPKTTSALSLMDGSPSEVDSEQLRELGIAIIKSST